MRLLQQKVETRELWLCPYYVTLIAGQSITVQFFVSVNIENFPRTQFTLHIITLQHIELIKSVLIAGKLMVLIYIYSS